MVTVSSKSLHHAQQLPFVLLEPAGCWPPTEPRREAVVSLQPNRRYDRWRDAEGTHIPVGCRVEQVAIAKEHGALTSRLHKRGDVLLRDPSPQILADHPRRPARDNARGRRRAHRAAHRRCRLVGLGRRPGDND
jgi:hypothetical protein